MVGVGGPGGGGRREGAGLWGGLQLPVSGHEESAAKPPGPAGSAGDQVQIMKNVKT